VGGDQKEMTGQVNDPVKEVESAREAFEQEFGRFARFTSPAGGGLSSLKDAESELRSLADLRVRHAGKKSAIAAGKKLIGRVPAEQRASFGQLVQTTEAQITESISAAELALKTFIENARTAREGIDVTIPGRRPRAGHLHPITLMRQRIEDIFVSLGYAVEDDREIETDFYNFDALNIPEGHPARDTQDTFYTTQGHALRSQTSTVQIHAMQRRGAPGA
jgi:phenylalanyl-tRNA synthetase alpha chain